MRIPSKAITPRVTPGQEGQLLGRGGHVLGFYDHIIMRHQRRLYYAKKALEMGMALT